jgi:hypothetical protein
MDIESDLSHCGRRQSIALVLDSGVGDLKDELLAKLVAAVIVLMGMLMWQFFERLQPIECQSTCSTDLSASRKPAR